MDLWLLGVYCGLVILLVLVITSVIGLFYYLRIVSALFGQPLPAENASPALSTPLSLADGLILTLLTLLLVWFGVYPTPLLEWIRSVVSALV